MKFEVEGSTAWISPEVFLEQSVTMLEQIRVRQVKRHEARQNIGQAFQAIRDADYGVYPDNLLNDIAEHISMRTRHEAEEQSSRTRSFGMLRRVVKTDLAVEADATFPCTDGMNDDHPDTYMHWRVMQGEQLTLIEEQSVQADRYDLEVGRYHEQRQRSFLVSSEMDEPLEQTWGSHRLMIGWDGEIDATQLELGDWFSVESVVENIASARRKHRISREELE